MTSDIMSPVYVFLLLFLASAREIASLQCYTCKDVHSFDSCKSTAICSGQQQCYTREKTIGRNKTFSMGCTNKQSCGPVVLQTMSAESPTEKCYECCGSDRCNGRLCNHPDPPPCIDKDEDCSFWNNQFNVCLVIHSAKFTCRKYCNLCSLVDGNWAEWSHWSGCDVTCGHGKHTRTRTCTNPAPAHGGWDCYGDSIDTKPCVRQLCPVHGGWSDWSIWGACPVTCGMGIQKRHRKCTDPVPLRYGNHCFGDSVDVQLCTQNHCAGLDGGWANWGNWNECSKSCDVGLRKRSRSCSNPFPGPYGKHCDGDTSQMEICNNKSCGTASHSSGAVAFNAYYVTDCSPASGQKMVFQNVINNLGAAYNNTSGVFLAPRGGTYIFTAQLCIVRNTLMLFGIMVGNISYTSVYRENQGANCICPSVQAAIDLKKNDSVHVQWLVYNYHTKEAVCQGSPFINYFSGSIINSFKNFK